MNHREYVMAKVLFIVPVIAVAAASAGNSYEMSRWTIDGGGWTTSVGGGLELSGTIGQPDAGAGVLVGGPFTMSGGFWFGTPPGDCNDTGGVNLLDYEALVGCMTGPDSRAVEPDCACYDLDRDGDVDLNDFSSFQTGFTSGG